MSGPVGPGADQLTWRPPTGEDLGAWAALLARAEAVDRVGEVLDIDDLAQELAVGWAAPDRDARLGWAVDGSLVAFGWAQCDPGARGDLRVFLWGEVDPAWRRRGVGTALLTWLAARGAATARAVDATRPAWLELRVDAANAARTAFADAHGHRPRRSFHTMTRDLRAPLPPRPTLPEGYQLGAWSPARDDDVRGVHTAAFADHWGSSVPTPDDWRVRLSGTPAFRPAWSRLVLAAGDVVAYQLAHEWPADAARKGWTEAWIGQLGTHRDHRGRGLGTLLLVDALHTFAAAGLQRAALDVDMENPTGALGLYERQGFTTWRTFVIHARPVV